MRLGFLVPPGDPVGRAFRAVTLRVRHVRLELEAIAGLEMLRAAAHGEPHLSLDDDRFRGERMGVRGDHGVRLPAALDDFVATGGTLLGGKALEGLHRFCSSRRSVAGGGVRDSAAISLQRAGLISIFSESSDACSCWTLRAPMIGAVTAG